MKLLQKDLDAVMVDWNQHLVKSTNNENQCPNGKRDLMYYLRRLYGTDICLHTVNIPGKKKRIQTYINLSIYLKDRK